MFTRGGLLASSEVYSSEKGLYPRVREPDWATWEVDEGSLRVSDESEPGMIYNKCRLLVWEHGYAHCWKRNCLPRVAVRIKV